MRSRLRLLVALAMIAAVLPLGAVTAGATGHACGDPFTPIYDMQGSGAATPLPQFARYTTEGVVTVDLQRDEELSGFFVQDATGDADRNTSDGIFVFQRDIWGEVEVGQHVRFEARLRERFGQTQLDFVADLIVCGSDTVKPTRLNAKQYTDDTEALEGRHARAVQEGDGGH